MKRLLLVSSLALLPLAACNPFGSGTTPDSGEQTSSRPETKNVIYRGTLQELGVSIYMEGTHRLELEDGRFVLLEANGILLDDYVGEEVEVFGTTRATVEGGGIIMRVERVAEITSSSSESSVASSASGATTSSSSSMAPTVSSVPPAASSAPAVASSSVTSSVASVASPSSTASDPVSARAAVMARANMAASNWTQEYCSSHVSFCFPVHKNWWYTSFGATASALWHVEMSSEEIVAIGDGPITVEMKSGAAVGSDGQVTIDGGTVTGIRTWAGNRHIVIKAPATLESAVRYITQELKAAPASVTQ